MICFGQICNIKNYFRKNISAKFHNLFSENLFIEKLPISQWNIINKDLRKLKGDNIHVTHILL